MVFQIFKPKSLSFVYFQQSLAALLLKSWIFVMGWVDDANRYFSFVRSSLNENRWLRKSLRWEEEKTCCMQTFVKLAADGRMIENLARVTYWAYWVWKYIFHDFAQWMFGP